MKDAGHPSIPDSLEQEINDDLQLRIPHEALFTQGFAPPPNND